MEAGVRQGGSRKEMSWGLGLGNLAQISLKSESFQRSQVEETCPGKGSPSVRLPCWLWDSKAAGAASLRPGRHTVAEPWEREEKASSSTLPDLPTAGC